MKWVAEEVLHGVRREARWVVMGQVDVDIWDRINDVYTPAESVGSPWSEDWALDADEISTPPVGVFG